MNQTLKTLAFVGVALCSVVVLAVTEWATAPRPLAEFGKVGEPFFPDFKDPREAVALRVVDFDEETASPLEFSVELRDGVWRIPSHYNYPADAAERLAKTAASVIGITRGALVSRHSSDHERYGVVDPLADATVSLKGRGQRLTLFKEGEVVLADLIIGNKVEGEDDVYYVRRADEKETYRAKLQIDLSTKFKDWVERDLLKASSSDFTVLEGERPIVDESRFPIIRVVGMERYRLTRKDSLSDWQLEGIDPEKEQVDQDAVRDMVFALSDLELVGVRPKPKFRGKPLLTADLEFNLPEEFRKQPELRELARQTLMADLQDKGFFLASSEDGATRLFSREGQLYAGTKDGVAYWLHFGNVFTGTEKEIELGGTVSQDKQPGEKKDGEGESKKDADDKSAGESKDDAAGDAQKSEGQSDAKDANNGGEKEQDGEGKESSLQKSRFVFIRATVDESLLGPRPQEPVKPKKPEGLQSGQQKKDTPAAEAKEAPADKASSQDDSDGTKQKPAAKKNAQKSAAKPAGDTGTEPAPKSQTPENSRGDSKSTTDKSTAAPGKADEGDRKDAEARATSVRSTRLSSTAAETEEQPAANASTAKTPQKPADDKPAQDKPAENKTLGDTSAQNKPADSKPAVSKPAENKASSEGEGDAPKDGKPTGQPKPSGGSGKDAGDAAKEKPTGADSNKAVDSNKSNAGDAGTAEGAAKAEEEGKGESASEKAEAKDPQKAYEEAMKEYERKLEQYKRDLKEYEEKVEKAREKVAELNARFADWYYLISADAFDKLRLTRDKIVKPKEKEETKDQGEAKSDEAAP